MLREQQIEEAIKHFRLWLSSASDDQLPEVALMMETLHRMRDVRCVLGSKSGRRQYEYLGRAA